MSYKTRLLALLFTLPAAHGQGPPVAADALRTRDGRLSVSVRSTTEHYYVLYRRLDLTPSAEEKAVAIKLGEAGLTTLTDPLGALGAQGYYRVAEHRRSTPADTDGDGIDDVTELLAPIRLSALKPAKEIAFRNGSTSLGDRESFKTFSYQGSQVPSVDRQLRNLEFVKFQIEKANTARPELFFVNTETHRSHPAFMSAIGLSGGGGGGRPGGGATSGRMPGVMMYWPLLFAPNGEPGLYTQCH